MQARTLTMEQAVVNQTDWYAGGRVADREPHSESQVQAPWPDPVEQVACWLEREDSLLDLGIGYGLCGLTILYVLGSLVRAVLGW